MAKIIKVEQTVPTIKTKKKVAAYARVSMESERMNHSLSAQISYYSTLIQKNPDWQYAGVFADDGISGTSIEKRDEFKRMIAAAEKGDIDIILTKSIQRFARNTVDLLETVWRLKDIGVEVRFEKEHINSMDGDGELMLTILASFAQEDSRSISENVQWGTRKRFEQGIPNGKFQIYGYRWDGDQLVVEPEEAKIVKLIYDNFLNGLSAETTEKQLAAMGVKSYKGQHFGNTSIRQILGNIALLADAVGLDITVDETESSVGDFNVDIFASETGTDRKIIIENQLEDTNHDHLGKLITYASGKSADVIIWVVKHAREEHKAAIEWLNNHTDEKIGFFLCEIKLYRIGTSEPAVKFEVIEKPNDWTKEVKKSESANETQQQRYDYWVAFQDYAFQNAQFAKNFNRRKPSMDHWMNFSVGSSACHIAVSQIQKRNELDVELYISEDKDLFHSLFDNKDAIEADASLTFDWRELPERKASRIVIEKSVTFGDKNQWNAQFDWLIDVMLKMKKAFKKYL